MRLFTYDPFSIRPRERCTVGALRAEAVDVDTRPVSRSKTPRTDKPELVNLSTVAEKLGAFDSTD
jgi:hypothetical protein